MAIKVRIPTPLQKLTNGQAEVECSATNVLELVDALEKDYPGMKERLSDGGKIRQVHQYLRERRGHPFCEQGRDCDQGWGQCLDRPCDCGRTRVAVISRS